MKVFLFLLYGLGRIVYSAIERQDKRFILLQFLGSALFIGAGFPLVQLLVPVVAGLVVGSLFIVTGLAPLILVPNYRAKTQPDMPSARKLWASIGIIDFVWLLLMGASVAFIMFAIGSPPFASPLPPAGLPAGYYQMLFDQTEFLLTKTIDAVTILGSVLAGCMAILWSGGIWRSGSAPDSESVYAPSLVSAIKMVLAFFIIATGIMICIGVPSYSRMLSIAELLR